MSQSFFSHLLQVLFFLGGLTYAALVFADGNAAESLSLSQYLSQVKDQNKAFQGATSRSEAAEERVREKDLLLSPALFANLRYVRDSKLPQLPIYTYSRIDTGVTQVGLSKVTSFGLQGRMYYEFDTTTYVGATLPVGFGLPLSFYDAKPVLELTQSFLSNGFGRATQANQDLIAAQQLANSHGAQFEAKQTLVAAELAYWRLATAREVVAIEERAIKQAQAISEWTGRRVRLNLADEGDALQAQAALESRRLELVEAKHEEQAAARNFNSLRNSDSSVVSESLSPLEIDWIETVKVPERKGTRDDVKAAEQQAHAMRASSVLVAEKTRPTLDVSASYAMNGRATSVENTLSNSYTANRPTLTASLVFQMPLDFDAAETTRAGATREQFAAEKTYRQKWLDAEQSWSDLTERLTNARTRFRLALTIEKTQEQKLVHERKRLRQGRTTTYQVLLFEQDFAQSELNRARLALDVLNLISQMKLYSSERV